MKSGEELALDAMKKELKRLTKAAEKAKQEADECCNITSEYIAIHNEFAEIVSSGESGQPVIDKLNSLKRRRDRANKIMNKDLIMLLDKQSEAELARDSLAGEIQKNEWRMSLRKAG